MQHIELAEEVPEDMETVAPEIYTQAKTDSIRYAFEIAVAASAQSGLKILKVSQNEGREILALQAEDAEAVVIQNFTTHIVNNEDYEFELGSHERNPDILFVVSDLPEELQETEDEQDEEE